MFLPLILIIGQFNLILVLTIGFVKRKFAIFGVGRRERKRKIQKYSALTSQYNIISIRAVSSTRPLPVIFFLILVTTFSCRFLFCVVIYFIVDGCVEDKPYTPTLARGSPLLFLYNNNVPIKCFRKNLVRRKHCQGKL